jgi:AraC-like DNA-binding protein
MEQASLQQPRKEPQEEDPQHKTRRRRLWRWIGLGEKLADRLLTLDELAGRLGISRRTARITPDLFFPKSLS